MADFRMADGGKQMANGGFADCGYCNANIVNKINLQLIGEIELKHSPSAIR